MERLSRIKEASLNFAWNMTRFTRPSRIMVGEDTWVSTRFRTRSQELSHMEKVEKSLARRIDKLV